MKREENFLVFLGLCLAGVLFLSFFGFGLSSSSEKKEAVKLPSQTSFEKSGVDLYFSLIEKEEEKLQTSLVLDPKNKRVVAVDVSFSFEPNVLEPVEIEPGELFENPIVLKKEVDSQKGKIRFALATKTPLAEKGPLLDLVFRVKQQGVPLEIKLLEEEIMIGALGETGNVLGESIDLSL